MRSAVIKPEEKFCDYFDDVKLTGFKDADNYFIIQRDDDDPKNFHIELNDQSLGCYNGLDSVMINENRIIFKLNRTGQQCLETEMIEIIDNRIDSSDYKEFISEIEIINQCLKNNSAQL